MLSALNATCPPDWRLLSQIIYDSSSVSIFVDACKYGSESIHFIEVLSGYHDGPFLENVPK